MPRRVNGRGALLESIQATSITNGIQVHIPPPLPPPPRLLNAPSPPPHTSNVVQQQLGALLKHLYYFLEL